MGSQCCRCANGKKQQITDYNSENINNIRFHGKHELSTIRYQIQTYGNAPQPRPKLSRMQGIFHNSPVINENSPDNYRLIIAEKNARKEQMNIQNISIERQDGEPPVFIRRFTDLVAKVGTRIRFLVEIQSSLNPKVTWHKDHKEIDIAESRFSLIHEGNFYCIDITQVRIEDEGYWTCLAENIYGRSSCTACLGVIIPRAYKKPQFVEELRALLTETGTVSLECKVVGIPTPVLKWFKDDKEIKAGDVFALTASPEDEKTSLGTYTCEAINCMGTAHSSSKIHVRDGDDKEHSHCRKSVGSLLPVFEKILRDESCKIGDDLTLSCKIIVPPWPKDVTWYNKVGRIKPNEKYNIREDGLGTYSIEIEALEAMDEGEWKCVATSFENAKQFTTCYISMIIPKNYRIPRFMEGLKAILTEEGLVSFECKVVGFPTPVLKWFKDGQELKPGDVYQLTGKNSLGLYCCIAKNCMGEAKSTAELTIEDIEQQLNEEERLQLSKESTQVPKFIKGLKSCEAMINENFTFTIQLDDALLLSSSEPSISWYRNDEQIIDNVKYKLIRESHDTFHIEIKKLELIDQAEWKCVAENDFGHSVTSCFLKLIIPSHFKKPKYLENLKAVFSKEGTVNLECKVIGVPQPVLKWYKDGIELKPGDIHRIISGENGTCCLGIYTCEATNCMGSVSSSASLLGFEDNNDNNALNKESLKENLSLEEVARNLSLSTIHEERTSQLYDTPQTEHSLSLDDRGEVSFSFDGKEVSVSLYETPDLTEEDAIKIIEMYADQLSEHISESNVVELPPMRFVKETSTTGNLLMEAIVIDISSDYFVANEYADDLCTEVDVEDVSIMDDQTQSIIMSSYSSAIGEKPPLKPPRKKQSENGSSKSENSEKNQQKSTPTLDVSESYYSAKELSSTQDHSLDILSSTVNSENLSLVNNEQIINIDTVVNEPDSILVIESSTSTNSNNNNNNDNNNILNDNSVPLFAIESKIDENTSELINYPKYSQIIEDELSTVEEESILYETPGIIENTSITLSKIHFAFSSVLEQVAMSNSHVDYLNINYNQNQVPEDIETSICNLLREIENLRQCIGDITITLADPIFSRTCMTDDSSNSLSVKFINMKVPLNHINEMIFNPKHNNNQFQYFLNNVASPMQELGEAIITLSKEIYIEPEVIQLLEDVMGNISAIITSKSYRETEFPIDESFTALNKLNIVPFSESDSESLMISDLSDVNIIIDTDKNICTAQEHEIIDTKVEVEDKKTLQTDTKLEQRRESEIVLNLKRSEQLNLWTLTLIEPLNHIANIGLSLDKTIDEQVHTLLCKPLHSLEKQIDLMTSEMNHSSGQFLDNDVETIIEGFLWPVNQLKNAIELAADIWKETPPNSKVRESLDEFANSISDLCEQLMSLRQQLIRGAPESSLQIQKADTSLIETITAVLKPLQNIQNIIIIILNSNQLTIDKYNENDPLSITSEKQEHILNKKEDSSCETDKLIEPTDNTTTNSELNLIKNLNDIELVKEDIATSIQDDNNEDVNTCIDRVDDIISSLTSLDRETVPCHEKLLSSKDNILNIIKDELHRQSALELATSNLLKGIQEKVDHIMLTNSNMNEESILEEMIRDITVEELQKTKMANNENTDEIIKEDISSSESPVNFSKNNDQYNNTCNQENQLEILPSSDSVETAKSSSDIVEIEDLSEIKVLNDVLLLSADSIDNQGEIDAKMNKVVAAKQVSSDDTIEHEVKVLVLSELGHAFANSIDIDEYKEVIKSKYQETILSCPSVSEHSISEESMEELIVTELEKQSANIIQFYSHDELKNIRATQTCTDITLEEVIKSLVTSELEHSFAKMIEEQTYTNPIKSNIQLIILNNPKFAQEHFSEEHIEDLIITELEKQKLRVIEAEADVSLREKEFHAYRTPMILRNPRDMEITVSWETSNENMLEKSEVSQQSIIVNVVDDNFASASTNNNKLILNCPQLLDEEVSNEPIERIETQEYNTDTANVHVVKDDKFEVKAEPSQLILAKAQLLDEHITDETIESIRGNEILEYNKEAININLVDDNKHKIEISPLLIIDPTSHGSVDDYDKNKIVSIKEKPITNVEHKGLEKAKIEPDSDHKLVQEDNIMSNLTDLSTDSSIEYDDMAKLMTREINIAESQLVDKIEMNQDDILSGKDASTIAEEKRIIAVNTNEPLLIHELSKEAIQDIVKLEISNAISAECSFKNIDINIITQYIYEKMATVPKEFDSNNLEEHAKRMVREKLLEVKMEYEKKTDEKLREKFTSQLTKDKTKNWSTKNDGEPKTIEIEDDNRRQSAISIMKQKEKNDDKETNIEEQKKVDDVRHKKGNDQSLSIEILSHEKIKGLEENDQSVAIETSSNEKMETLKEDNIEKPKKVENICSEEENNQTVAIEMSRHEKITAVKKNSIEKPEKIEDICFKEENNQYVAIESPSHKKGEALKKVDVEKPQKIGNTEENDRSLSIEPPSYEQMKALTEDSTEEQQKIENIRFEKENDRSLVIESSRHKKIEALKEENIINQSVITEALSQEKITSLREEHETVNVNIEETMPRKDMMSMNFQDQEKEESKGRPIELSCENKLLEQEKLKVTMIKKVTDTNVNVTENSQIEGKKNTIKFVKNNAEKLAESYRTKLDDDNLEKIELEKDNDMSLECSRNSEAAEEIYMQKFEKIPSSRNKEVHVQSDSDSLISIESSSLSSKLNVKSLDSTERDLCTNVPSISIGCDESIASDQSRYSDVLLAARSHIYHPLDSEGGISDYSSSTRGLTTTGPKDTAKKPVFCMKLTNRNAITTSRIKLTCTVLGEPEPDIIWLKNNKELEESSNRYCITNDNGILSLEIYSLRIEDSGEYSCIAKNIHGRACTEAKLKVYAGYESTPSVPIFTRSIRDKFEVNENKVILECNVKAQPPPIITWLKDDKIIKMDNRYKQSDLSDGMCRLEISNPCSDDNGMYMCRAENECGFSHSISHLLYYSNNKVDNHRERDTTSCRSSSINYDGTNMERFTKRPYFSSYLTDHSVPAGGTIGLQVQVESASTPEVTWLRNDTRTPIFLPEAQFFSDRNIYTLILPNASESESGTYICRASNAYGYTDSAARVEIVSRNLGEGGKPAIFLSHPVDKLIYAYIGEDVSLSFRATGVPKPKVILMKGLTDITNGARAYKESHDDYVRITFKRVQISDEGTYCILVKNRYGCDRSFFTIRIKQRARSLTPSTDWNIENMENFLRYIQDANQASLSKKVPGSISSEPVVIDGGKTWLALTWGKAEPQVTAPVTAYRVDAWLLGGDGGARWMELGITSTNSFDAFNLRPGGEYKFRITPRNRYGWGESVVMKNSVKIEETIAFPEFSKILPGQLKVLKDTTLNLSCKIKSDSTTHIRWYKDSVEINISDNSRFIINRDNSKCTLIIKDIEENDSGRYVCDATNSAGRVSTFARVQVVTDPKIVEADMKFRKMRFMDVLNDDRPPEFTMRLRDRRVQTTFPVRLTCQVSGYPEPEVTWYKSDEKIINQMENMTISKDEAHFHTLEINRAKINDTGIYMASAENLYGSVCCRCHLVVDEGIRAYICPEFSQPLKEIYTVNYNEELRMNAQVKAYPAVGITWYRDGKHLRPGRNTVISLNHDGTIELTLAHITHGDTGIYCCVAINEVGRAETVTRVQISTNSETIDRNLECLPEISETLTIPYSKAPVFITKPLSTEAFEGDNIIIMCEVTGDPKPEVIWLRDFLRPDYYKDSPHFRRIGLGPQYRLEIPYAKLDFTGTYSVIAKNSYGEAKAIISLQIYARDPDEQRTLVGQNIKHSEILTIPVLKNSLKDIRCCDGDAVTFSCIIRAIPAPNIRWEKGGKLVVLGGDITTDFDGELARLHIEHVYPEDEGEYTCIVYNTLGNARTSACLIVDVPESKEVSLNRRLKKPTSLLFSQSVTPLSTPRLTPVRSLSPLDPKHELRLTLDGSYTRITERGCRGKKIPTSPKFYAIPHNRVVEEGDTVRFQCAVAGHPMPWAHWDKDGITIMSNARISIIEKNDVKILEIVEIIYDDAGLYRITLENEIGRVQATARLEVIRGRYSLPSKGTIKKFSSETDSLYYPSCHQYSASSLRIKNSSVLDEENIRERTTSPIFPPKPSHHRSVNF